MDDFLMHKNSIDKNKISKELQAESVEKLFIDKFKKETKVIDKPKQISKIGNEIRNKPLKQEETIIEASLKIKINKIPEKFFYFEEVSIENTEKGSQEKEHLSQDLININLKEQQYPINSEQDNPQEEVLKLESLNNEKYPYPYKLGSKRNILFIVLFSFIAMVLLIYVAISFMRLSIF